MSWIVKVDREQNVVQTLNNMLSLVGLSHTELSTRKCSRGLHLKT